MSAQFYAPAIIPLPKPVGNVLINARAIAQMKHPSIPDLLHKHGYHYEGNAVAFLIKAIEAFPDRGPDYELPPL
jgi:hypothetical protein